MRLKKDKNVLEKMELNINVVNWQYQIYLQ